MPNPRGAQQSQTANSQHLQSPVPPSLIKFAEARENDLYAIFHISKKTSVPVPKIICERLPIEPWRTRSYTSYIHGTTLGALWPLLSETNTIAAKERICRQLWSMLYQLRHHIAKPAGDAWARCYQVDANASASMDLLIGNAIVEGGPVLWRGPPLESEEAFRERICNRWFHVSGYASREDFLSKIPRSESCVFTHGNILPRSIIVREREDGGNEHNIVGVVDWERAGWYPEWWEYANIMRPTRDENHKDFQRWMQRTAPKKWDIEAIARVRRVQFERACAGNFDTHFMNAPLSLTDS